MTIFSLSGALLAAVVLSGTCNVVAQLPQAALPVQTLVTFGDSYTDQSRLTYFNTNHSYPPLHYQEVYPPGAHAANGGASWVRYAEMYSGVQSYNYAVSGAACSNALTGRPGQGAAVFPDAYFPGVQDYEIGAFAADWVIPAPNGAYFNELNPLTTVYSLWIGTNDVGINSLLTGNQTAGVTIVNVTECAISWMQQMYTYGARRFILQNMIPLDLAPVYAVGPDPLDHYWPVAHNRTDYNIQLQELVMSGNALWDLQVPAALITLPGASAAVFNSHALFTDMYNNPSMFLNGTAPLNVTGYYAHSNASGGDVYFVNNSPDSFLFYDGLHPSEQVSRHVATEIVKTLNRTSAYATYYGIW
ncbi:hypothetical protein DACRYDRAFT_111369 [Dacryopinax primogenitus]|uniref:GDSL lipase/acylhydrolase n=1 Tax=Dacryopinax primogenitus (strain DJM 731) TaxID=1858805 RepID=M5FRY6_DACPD|nr:uncharacterized protein DACRYDRAFT_111369 [Dacryopinax primogenitus]EJT97849.1 hypothetical protein DACRYDRAFT_111369 [Dacryopinax primogenitus]